MLQIRIIRSAVNKTEDYLDVHTTRSFSIPEFQKGYSSLHASLRGEFLALFPLNRTEPTKPSTAPLALINWRLFTGIRILITGECLPEIDGRRGEEMASLLIFKDVQS